MGITHHSSLENSTDLNQERVENGDFETGELSSSPLSTIKNSPSSTIINMTSDTEQTKVVSASNEKKTKKVSFDTNVMIRDTGENAHTGSRLSRDKQQLPKTNKQAGVANATSAGWILVTRGKRANELVDRNSDSRCEISPENHFSRLT